MKKLKSILLVDDSEDDNFIHKRILLKSDVVSADNIFIRENGEEAIDFLVDPQSQKKCGVFPPELILLDINMPCMDGFEFLEVYQKLKDRFDTTIIVMLTTSENAIDKDRAAQFSAVSDYIEKPLTKEKIQSIYQQYFASKETP